MTFEQLVFKIQTTLNYVSLEMNKKYKEKNKIKKTNPHEILSGKEKNDFILDWYFHLSITIPAYSSIKRNRFSRKKNIDEKIPHVLLGKPNISQRLLKKITMHTIKIYFSTAAECIPPSEKRIDIYIDDKPYLLQY